MPPTIPIRSRTSKELSCRKNIYFGSHLDRRRAEGLERGSLLQRLLRLLLSVGRLHLLHEYAVRHVVAHARVHRLGLPGDKRQRDTHRGAVQPAHETRLRRFVRGNVPRLRAPRLCFKSSLECTPREQDSWFPTISRRFRDRNNGACEQKERFRFDCLAESQTSLQRTRCRSTETNASPT